MPPVRAALLACLTLAGLAAFPAAAWSAREPVETSAVPVATRVESIAAIVVDRDQDTVLDRKGQQVRIQGVVTAAPETFGDRMFQAFVQDASGGIMLFSRNLRRPMLVGDRVDVTGELNQFRGAAQIKDVSIRSIGRAEVPAPLAVEGADADSWKHMGKRVRVDGVAGALTLDTFGKFRLTGDDGAVLSVFVPENVARAVNWQLYPRGSRVEVTGIVSIYKHTWPYNGSFQLVLTDPEDLHLLEAPPPAWQAWAMWAVATACILLGLALLVFYIVQRRQKARERELATLSALSSAFAGPDLGQEQLARHACEILTVYGVTDAALVHVFDEHGRLSQLAAAAVDPMVAAKLHAAEPQTDPESPPEDSRSALEARIAQKGLTLLAVHSLLATSGTQGFLSALSSRKRRQTDMQERTLLSAVKLLALALENCRIQERARIEQQELQYLVVTDELTKLYNRRFLDEYLRVQVPLAQRRGGGLAFLTIDIDHFKTINDTYGHDAGDRVLAGVAATLRAAARSSDLPVRMGGEEFLMVVAEQDSADAMALAERLRAAVQSQAFDDVVEGQHIRVTISIGVSLFGVHGTTAASLLRASDEAMYASKRGGRNRSSLATYSELTA